VAVQAVHKLGPGAPGGVYLVMRPVHPACGRADLCQFLITAQQEVSGGVCKQSQWCEHACLFVHTCCACHHASHSDMNRSRLMTCSSSEHPLPLMAVSGCVAAGSCGS
jgi:hypothetical protein